MTSKHSPESEMIMKIHCEKIQKIVREWIKNGTLKIGQKFPLAGFTGSLNDKIEGGTIDVIVTDDLPDRIPYLLFADYACSQKGKRGLRTWEA